MVLPIVLFRKESYEESRHQTISPTSHKGVHDSKPCVAIKRFSRTRTVRRKLQRIITAKQNGVFSVRGSVSDVNGITAVGD